MTSLVNIIKPNEVFYLGKCRGQLTCAILQREWPQRITSENMVDLTDERNLLGTREDILNQLRDATRILTS